MNMHRIFEKYLDGDNKSSWKAGLLIFGVIAAVMLVLYITS